MSAPKAARFVEASKATLLRRMRQEHRAEFLLPVHFGLTALLGLVGNLQLALRHPANTGPSAKMTRQIIALIIERVKAEGFPAHAEAMRLGDDSVYDEE